MIIMPFSLDTTVENTNNDENISSNGKTKNNRSTDISRKKNERESDTVLSLCYEYLYMLYI
jgi:hypothetical protein